MFKVKYKREGHFDILSTSEFQKFNPSILGLGELAKEGTLTHAIAAIFDLEGFTDFCNQIDSHLVVPVSFKIFRIGFSEGLRRNSPNPRGKGKSAFGVDFRSSPSS
jgi:hypothetical protein